MSNTWFIIHTISRLTEDDQVFPGASSAHDFFTFSELSHRHQEKIEPSGNTTSTLLYCNFPFPELTLIEWEED